MTNRTGEIPQIHDLTSKDAVPERPRMEEGHYQTTYSYSSQVVMTLD